MYIVYHINVMCNLVRSTINCAVQAAAAAETSTLREQVKQLEALRQSKETVSGVCWHHCPV